MHKLIFVINTLQKGGAERVLSTLANGFSERGYAVKVVCLNHAEQAYQLSPAVGFIQLLQRPRKKSALYRPLYGLMTYLRLVAVLRKERPMCVIAFMSSANLWAGLCCRRLDLPYIVSERTTPDLTVNRLPLVAKWLFLWVYRQSKALVLPAKGMEKALRRDAVFRELNNYVIIRNPVNRFPAISAVPVHGRKFILAAGRLEHEKGFDRLIEAFSMLDNEDTDLLIVGEGSQRERLREQISALQLQDRIHLSGLQHDIQNYYAQAELFVLPSRSEGYPNVLLEAMSMGSACIASNCEFGPQEMIHQGINGMLLQEGSPRELAVMMQHLLGHPALAEKLGAAAQEIAQTNSLQRIAEQWEDLILN